MGSDFQNLAHFAKHPLTGIASHIGWSPAELAAKGVGEVAMAGKPEFEGKRGKVARAFGQFVE